MWNVQYVWCCEDKTNENTKPKRADDDSVRNSLNNVGPACPGARHQVDGATHLYLQATCKGKNTSTDRVRSHHSSLWACLTDSALHQTLAAFTLSAIYALPPEDVISPPPAWYTVTRPSDLCSNRTSESCPKTFIRSGGGGYG